MKNFKGKIACIPRAAIISCAVILSGCVTTQGEETGAKLGQFLGRAITGAPAQQTAVTSSSAPMSGDPRRGIRGIGETELAGFYTAKPLRMANGRNAEFPRVAITVDDHFNEHLRAPRPSDCYFMHARIWESPTKSRDVAPFSVCGKDIKEPSGGFLRSDSTISAWNSGISTTGQDHTGSTRTEGPKFPQRPVPSGPLDAVGILPSDTAYFFVHATMTNMGFDFTQTDPRVWFVKFGKLDPVSFQAYQEAAQRQTKLKTDEKAVKPLSVSAGVGSVGATEVILIPDNRPAGPAMTYATLMKTISAAKGHVPTVNSKLVGKSIQLTLKAPGPDSLVVDLADEVFFRCIQRAPGFKGGKLTAIIAGYEDTPEGHGPMVVLQRCP